MGVDNPTWNNNTSNIMQSNTAALQYCTLCKIILQWPYRFNIVCVMLLKGPYFPVWETVTVKAKAHDLHHFNDYTNF